MNDKIKVIILAAGKGKRMQSDEPKALAKLKGKYFLEHIIDTVRRLDQNIKPVIVVGHKKERIEEVFGKDHTYALQEEQLGTGHAVKSAKNFIDDGKDGVVLVISADQPFVSKETLELLIQTHLEKKPTITLGTIEVPDFLEWRSGMNGFGRVVRREDGSVEKIIEFRDATPQEQKIKEVNPALYVFDAKWLYENIDKLHNQNDQAEYLLTDLVHIAFDQNKKIEAVPLANIMEGIQPNSKEDLEILENLLE